MNRPVSVVVATRNRRASLLSTLERLRALPERPAIVVVDNGSADGSAEAVGEGFPEVEVVRLDRNAGAAARTLGARVAATPYVAFSDDDSWWAPGALARAADLLDAHPRVALVAARVLVGPDERIDPTCERMARSELGQPPGQPGRLVLGFIACGAVVRRSAFLEVGGFAERSGIGGEEELLALDVATHGWTLVYRPDVVAHHDPATVRDPEARRRVGLRNRLRTAWLRRPLVIAVRETASVARVAVRERAAREALREVAGDFGRIARTRHLVPQHVEAQLVRLGR